MVPLQPLQTSVSTLFFDIGMRLPVVFDMIGFCKFSSLGSKWQSKLRLKPYFASVPVDSVQASSAPSISSNSRWRLMARPFMSTTKSCTTPTL